MELSSSISTRLEYQHKSLIEVIDGLSDEQLRRQVLTGKWSIFENIVHLQTYQHIFLNRIKEMMRENNPLFPRYTAEADPLFLENCEKSIREILHDMLTTRQLIFSEMLAYAPTDLDRTASHPHYGKLTAGEWNDFFLLHEAHHLFTIFKLSAELKRSPD